MKTSAHGLDFISRWEGEVRHVYLDCVGIPTIGVGHVVLPGESFPAEISHEQVLALLGRDISKCEDSIARYVSAALNQNQHDALASFTFNCGGGALEKSSLRAKLNRGDYVGAADGLLAWCKAGGKDNTGLLNRRKAERALFLAPVAAPPPIEVTPFDLQQLVNVAPHA